MTTTIRITPTLTGKASQDFNKSLASNQLKKISPEKKRKMAELVHKVLSNHQ